MEKTISEAREAYAWQLAAGMCSASLKTTAEVQVNRYTEAQIANQALLMRVSQILSQRGVPGVEYVGYYAFAEKLARLCRKYSSRVLARAAEDLVDRWEFRGLDHQTLFAVRDEVYVIEDRADSVSESLTGG